MSSQRDEQIIALARQKVSYGEIAKRFNLSKGRISQICIANGVIQRPLDVNVNNIKDEKVQQEVLDKQLGRFEERY